MSSLKELADFLENNTGCFSQGRPRQCVVGLGLRLQPDGTLKMFEAQSPIVFAKKYGISDEDAHAIYQGRYHDLGIGMENGWWSTPIPPGRPPINQQVAIDMLRKLSDKYDSGSNPSYVSEK